MTPLLAVWLALLVLAVPVVIGIGRQWDAGDLSPRDARLTLLLIAALLLAAVTVLALLERHP